MTYAHDIFISYRRDTETLTWIEKHFVPLLTIRVRQELLTNPDIYVDDQLESGVSWPEQLGLELGRSRVLIPLLAKDYFSSHWCVREFSMMLAREQQCALRTVANPRGVVIPVVIHDGDKFPSVVTAIQRFEVINQFNLRMPTRGKLAAKLDRILEREAPAIASAITSAPPWREEWAKVAASQFQQALSAASPSQRSAPRFG